MPCRRCLRHLRPDATPCLWRRRARARPPLVPLALLDAPWRGDGRIVVLEPRRVAARAAATRMASLLGESAGRTVGFRTRLEARSPPRHASRSSPRACSFAACNPIRGWTAWPWSSSTRSTSGRWNPTSRWRSASICSAMLRPELRLLAMSATADGARLSTLHGRAGDRERRPDVPGRGAPRRPGHARAARVAGRTGPRGARRRWPNMRATFWRSCRAWGKSAGPMAALDGCGAVVLPLHGDLPPAEQDRALRPAEGRRVVLATSIAETTLTVPGVRVVVDGGWRRAPRLDPSTGLTRLATLRISRAAADQRAGRAGREAPGVAIRLWSEALHRGLAPFDRPEILEAELVVAGAGLRRLGHAAGGTGVPGRAACRRAGRRPRRCSRSWARWMPTGGSPSSGRRMARLGAHPRLAAMMLAADDPAEAALAADLAALLEERDPLRAAGAGRHRPAAGGASPRRPGGADRGALSRIRPGRRGSTGGVCACRPRARRSRGAMRADCWPRVSRPDRAARGEPGSFRLSGGGGARLPRDRSAGAACKLLAVAGLEMKTAARITLAAPLDAGCAAAVARRAGDRARGKRLRRGTGAVFAAGGGGSARWCSKTASCPPIRRRWPRRWRACSAEKPERCPGPTARASFRPAPR